MRRQASRRALAQAARIRTVRLFWSSFVVRMSELERQRMDHWLKGPQRLLNPHRRMTPWRMTILRTSPRSAPKAMRPLPRLSPPLGRLRTADSHHLFPPHPSTNAGYHCHGRRSPDGVATHQLLRRPRPGRSNQESRLGRPPTCQFVGPFSRVCISMCQRISSVIFASSPALRKRAQSRVKPFRSLFIS